MLMAQAAFNSATSLQQKETFICICFTLKMQIMRWSDSIGWTISDKHSASSPWVADVCNSGYDYRLSIFLNLLKID